MPENMTDDQMKHALEALLFVSDEPVSAVTLAEILEASPAEVASGLAELAADFREQERGIQLREVAGGWRLYSHPAYHELIEKYVLSWDTHKLSQAALEALAVIAYHQPVTRAGVNAVRGVSSEAVISSLVEKGLVREVGRDPGPGNAILYGTSRTFLEKFGLKTLKDLPDLEEFAPDEESREYIRERLSAGPLSAALDVEEEAEDDLSDADNEDALDEMTAEEAAEAEEADVLQAHASETAGSKTDDEDVDTEGHDDDFEIID